MREDLCSFQSAPSGQLAILLAGVGRTPSLATWGFWRATLVKQEKKFFRRIGSKKQATFVSVRHLSHQLIRIFCSLMRGTDNHVAVARLIACWLRVGHILDYVTFVWEPTPFAFGCSSDFICLLVISRKSVVPSHHCVCLCSTHPGLFIISEGNYFVRKAIPEVNCT